jgi:hypothetical protein
MNNSTLYNIFKNIPKMTNNHIHIYALYPYDKLLTTIKKIDPELYKKIYIYTKESDDLHKNSLMLINEKNEGITYNEKTNINDWIPLNNFPKKDFILTKNTENPWDKLERIQSQVRIFIRHFKIYYYLIYLSLHKNYEHKIYYLNLRGKPGSINKDVKFGTRLFLTKRCMDVDLFNTKMKKIIQHDTDLKENDLKYMYRIYGKIKCESDIILLAVNNFNETNEKPDYITENEILNTSDIKYIFSPKRKNTQMMLQYIITFPKPEKKVLLTKEYINNIKIHLYCAVLINEEYGFDFFNGIDLVGNEKYSECLDNLLPLLEKLLHFKKFGINFIPHFGETNIICGELKPDQEYILNKNLKRIGHGLAFINSQYLINYINKEKKHLYLEICPISNYLLQYYKISKHPAKNLIYNDYIHIMIGSDDNGLFGYNTVTHDYILIYKYWKLKKDDIKKIILNGLDVIPQNYLQYYIDIFNKEWSAVNL